MPFEPQNPKTPKKVKRRSTPDATPHGRPPAAPRSLAPRGRYPPAQRIYAPRRRPSSSFLLSTLAVCVAPRPQAFLYPSCKTPTHSRTSYRCRQPLSTASRRSPRCCCSAASRRPPARTTSLPTAPPCSSRGTPPCRQPIRRFLVRTSNSSTRALLTAASCSRRAAAAIFAGILATIAARQAARRAHALYRAMWSLPEARHPMGIASATMGRARSTSAARLARRRRAPPLLSRTTRGRRPLRKHAPTARRAGAMPAANVKSQSSIPETPRARPR